MKKIVIAMLLLLPLIIVASVLVATSVISNEAYIAVESVSLNVDTSRTVEVGLSSGQFRLIATVYPTGAKNKDVIWSLENVQCFGDEISDPVTIDQTGLITFRTYCAFDAVVTTVEGSKTARCNFYVKCDTLDGVGFTPPEEALKTGESYALTATFMPADAEVDEVVWTSSAPDVVSVDGNGILTAHSEGSAEISVAVKDRGDIPAYSATVTAVPGVTRYGTKFSLSADSFPISDLHPAGDVAAISGCVVENGVLTFTSDSAVIGVGSERVEITKCAYDDIVVKNAEILRQKIWHIGKLPLYLAAAYADAARKDTPSASFATDSPSSVEIDVSGKAVFKDKGAIRLIAESGNASASITVEVVRPVAYVRLNTVDNDDKRGIAAETVYGTRSYDDGVLSGYRIPLSIQYPADADWSDFDLSVSDESLAEINGNTVIIKGGAPAETVLTVSVTAHYSAFVSVPARANRHFTLRDGVNCFTYADVSAAAAAGENIMLRTNITAGSGDGTLILTSDFYGNAYMLDATRTVKSSETPILKVAANGVTVSNAHIRCDDAAKINEANGMSGAAVWVGDTESEELLTDVRVEYSVMENGYYALASMRAQLTVDGCIMRNTSNFGIHIINGFNSSGEYVYSDVTVNNCIISNIVATAVGISTQDSEADGSPLAVQSTFSQTGFLDIYNWQDVTSMRMLDRELIPDNAAANEVIKKVANSMIGAEIQKDIYAPLRVEIDGVIYVNLGIVTAGALHLCTTVPTFEDERFIIFPITILDQLSSITKPLGFVLDPCVLYLYDNTSDITPDSRFSEDADTYVRLRGGK